MQRLEPHMRAWVWALLGLAVGVTATLLLSPRARPARLGPLHTVSTRQLAQLGSSEAAIDTAQQQAQAHLLAQIVAEAPAAGGGADSAERAGRPQLRSAAASARPHTRRGNPFTAARGTSSVAGSELLAAQLERQPESALAPAPDGTAQQQQQKLFASLDAEFKRFAEVHGNITEAMVDQAYCTSREQGFRFQVVGGQLLVVGASESFQTRLLNIQRQLYAVAQRWPLPDVDMMIEQSDWPTVGPVTPECPQRGPVIAPAKHTHDPAHSHVILGPDHTFGEWIEVMTPSWAEMQQLLAGAAANHPWERRAPTLLFRGAPTGTIRRELGDAVRRNWDAANNWRLDVEISERIHSPQEFKSLYQHCSHKYLLHLPGNSYSGRLKYLLACGSTVVWLGVPGANLTTSYQEFWYPLLKDQEHLLFVEAGRGADLAAELSGALQALVDDDGTAQWLGRAAQALMRDVLTPDAVQHYWYRLILRYAQLQAFQPRVHPDAVPIEEAMLSRRWTAHDKRTCPRCRPDHPLRSLGEGRWE